MALPKPAIFVALTGCAFAAWQLGMTAMAATEVRIAAGDQNQSAGATEQKPALRGDAAATPGQDPASPLYQCKLGCKRQCGAMADPEMSQACFQACETKCDKTYGQ